ncbi:MAG: hypothetical protein A2234_04240 [Elusimicrobia bacterium RIFOXYA2_FULL_58_8]|nr:MAG: hypothetical protein A2285_01055 [Elusimicrobia bacterium RIFOXYA12_FULL_57_11]OGS16330.1 MAG: hypothetical protein A2234_04240 [Elusimicrobia bacterium RIFOXYA2_FULL_58_8]
MDHFNTLGAVIERPELLACEEPPADLGRVGLLGYVAGALGIFVFLRMFSVVLPGILSFLMVLFFVLAANLLFAALTHLFMELTGARGRAARLFLAFGYSDFFLALLVPLGFFAKLGSLNAFLCFCLCAAAVLYARVMLVRRLYPVSANKAVLSVWLPYAGVVCLVFFGFTYFMAWLIWLII